MSDRASGTAEPLAVDVKPTCDVCGKAATRVQVIPPGRLPSDFATWDREGQDRYLRHHDSTQWRFIYSGVEGGNGGGDDIPAGEAARLAAAFSEPLTYDKVTTSGLFDEAGYCAKCRVPYCFEHWGAGLGSGTCPRGHWKSLDPHWSPDWDA